MPGKFFDLKVLRKPHREHFGKLFAIYVQPRNIIVEGMRRGGRGSYSKCLICISSFDSDNMLLQRQEAFLFSFPVLQIRKQRLGEIT